MKRGFKLEITINLDEILKSLEDAGKWLLAALKEYSLYVNIALGVIIIILIICAAVSRSKRRIIVEPVNDETVKRKRKIRYQDIDWDIEKEDKVQTELEKEFTPMEDVIPDHVDEETPQEKENMTEKEDISEKEPEEISYEEILQNITKAEEPIQIEQINLVKAQPSRKFGPDNKNTSRSGRIFTEEELKTQIRE